MRIPRWGICVLGVAWGGLTGCSQTGWLRPGVPANMKTEAAVGGRPVSTASGEPGSGTAVRQDVDDLGPPPSAGARISGRVFDEDGRAVPNARVRLGVGGTAGGRVNYATTDRSGAFTLHGVRPGRDYTLIAEYQAADGVMSGRSQVHAPDTSARIVLGARDHDAEPSRAAKILPARVRSGLFPDGNADGFPATARPRVQETDEPADAARPADETTAYAPKARRPAAARTVAASESEAVRAGWTFRQPPSRSRGRAEADGIADGPPGPADRTGGEDGENPLPPALEPVGSDEPRTAGRVGANSGLPETVRVALAQRKARARAAALADPQDDAYADRESGASAPRPSPEDTFTPANDVATATYARPGRRAAEDVEDPPPAARKTTTARRGQRPSKPAASQLREVGTPEAGDAPTSDEGIEGNPPRRRSGNGKRPTWRELSISPDEVPVDESLRRSSVDEPIDEGDAVIRAGGPVASEVTDEAPRAATAREKRPSRETGDGSEPMPMPVDIRPRQMRPSLSTAAAARALAAPSASRKSEPVCRLDSGRRRIVELQLPGVDGRMISLADMDADLILLDFWGSWCRECERSIEHHSQIQEQLGGKTLQIVGVACEKGATFEARRDAAIAAARKLGINYPMLVTGMDGNCPVQKALQVQFYPSMMLIDREGNILQFEQGATDATLARIDRAIAKAVRDGDRRIGD